MSRSSQVRLWLGEPHFVLVASVLDAMQIASFLSVGLEFS